ncbi:MAG: hypothetical protein GX283_03420 [Clostridiaceae bacterium]|jgi:hypothetical protein|nr:hypothetical protein [Clostridiaceae bacterium]
MGNCGGLNEKAMNEINITITMTTDTTATHDFGSEYIKIWDAIHNAIK